MFAFPDFSDSDEELEPGGIVNPLISQAEAVPAVTPDEELEPGGILNPSIPQAEAMNAIENQGVRRKGPGRPRKNQQAANKEKRPRGRPRKHPLPLDKEKRPRGRPPKKNSEDKENQPVIIQDINFSDTEELMEVDFLPTFESTPVDFNFFNDYSLPQFQDEPMDLLENRNDFHNISPLEEMNVSTSTSQILRDILGEGSDYLVL